MKSTDKRRKAAYLLDEIGGVSDFYLQEARNYRPTPKKHIFRNFILVAATLSLVFSILFIMLLPALRAIVASNVDHEVPPETREEDSRSNADSTVTDSGDPMAVAIRMAPETSYRALSSPEAAQLLLGERHILWEAGGTVYVSRTLSENEIKRVTDRIGEGRQVGETSPDQNYRVWITLGDGRVISPYLNPSPGNVGIDLFDYEVEYIPSNSFASVVSDILSTH